MLSLFDPIIRLFDADSEPSAAVARGHHWFDSLTVKLANAANRREFLRVGATGVPGSALSSCIPPLACCNHHLLNVTVSPVAFGAGITVSGNQYLGAAGDTYWIGVCGDNSRYCQTQNWLWSLHWCWVPAFPDHRRWDITLKQPNARHLMELCGAITLRRVGPTKRRYSCSAVWIYQAAGPAQTAAIAKMDVVTR